MKDFLPLCQQVAAENTLLGVPLVQASLDYLQRSIVDLELDALVAHLQQQIEEKDELYFSLDPPGCIHKKIPVSRQQARESQDAFRMARTLQAIADALKSMKEGSILRSAWYELSFATEDRELSQQCIEIFNSIQRTSGGPQLSGPTWTT
jgi:hypothetical protein